MRSLDTGRFIRFRWRPITFITVLEKCSFTKEDLFRFAIPILENISFPFSVLLNRYEKVGNKGVVISVDVRCSCICSFLKSQAVQNELSNNLAHLQRKEIESSGELFIDVCFVINFFPRAK
eukprot:TRINITY_DN24129_c0_g1_i1.p1 TRINITY_DN24129_c0_g1~~TRINITY_DN24129_c0_g1_i1.p1  ORF type:complete len:121 (-),score=12.32 TRINITY_DN24129_c0_g1_i1:82-444(-)